MGKDYKCQTRQKPELAKKKFASTTHTEGNDLLDTHKGRKLVCSQSYFAEGEKMNYEENNQEREFGPGEDSWGVTSVGGKGGGGVKHKLQHGPERPKTNEK